MACRISPSCTKPLLERRRRARINKCLDELKDLMVFALEQEESVGEGGVVRLEKADILEVTVRHMRKLKAANSLCVTPSTTYAQRFRIGFATCAVEAREFIAAPGSGFDPKESRAIISHLSDNMQLLASLPPSRFSNISEASRGCCDPLDDRASEDFDDEDDVPMDLSHQRN